MPTTFEPQRWLDLGIAGAALFLILIIVVMLFKQNTKGIDKLCTKIDQLVDSLAASNNKLTEVLICNDKDQKQVLNMLNEIYEVMLDIQRRTVRIDTRLFDQSHSKEEHTND